EPAQMAAAHLECVGRLRPQYVVIRKAKDSPLHKRCSELAMQLRLFALVSVGLITLSGCAPILVAGAAEGGKVMAQERPLGTAMNDIGIQTDIEAKLAEKSFKLFRHVDVRVIEGRVLLAGRVKNDDTRIEAGKLAWAVSNVKEVNNELVVGSKGGIATDLN